MQNSVICPCCQQPIDGLAFLADPISQTISKGSKKIRFSRQQFAVAQALINAFPGMITKNHLYDTVFSGIGGDGPDIKIIDVRICHIRPFMAELGMVIETVWGQGYKLLAADAEDANNIKDASFRRRGKGSSPRWKPEHDAELLDLHRRKFTVTQCATKMRLPYMTVERNLKRLLTSETPQ